MIALAIILTGIGSYTLRAFFIFALSRYTFPPLLIEALEYVAPTVMASLVISMRRARAPSLRSQIPAYIRQMSAPAKWPKNARKTVLRAMNIPKNVTTVGRLMTPKNMMTGSPLRLQRDTLRRVLLKL